MKLFFYYMNKFSSFAAFLIFIFFNSSCSSQNLLNLPESIIFDVQHNRYLISNYNTGDIIQIDSNGHQSYFVQGMNAIQGLEIVGNAVYVGAGQMVRGFDLDSGQMIMDIHVNNVSNLNDITSDTSGNLYASDVFGTKIIKVNIATNSYSVFVDGSGINRPNGIFYDIEYNRILVCSYRSNSPIQAINLEDSSVTTIVNSSISNCDGITKDGNGNCYVTSWATYSIYKYDPLFSQPPEIFYTNSCGPADISYDSVHNVIAVPLQPCNSWTTIPALIGVKNFKETTPESFYLYQNYPNPFNPFTRINYELPVTRHVRLAVFDIMGKEIQLLVDENQRRGKYEVGWEASKSPSGIYFCKMEAGDFVSAKKMVLIK